MERRGGERREVVGINGGGEVLPVGVQEVWEDNRMELFVTYGCYSVFLREDKEGDSSGEWRVTREIQWNCRPRHIVTAFPYIVAFSSDTVEIR